MTCLHNTNGKHRKEIWITKPKCVSNVYQKTSLQNKTSKYEAKRVSNQAIFTDKKTKSDSPATVEVVC